MKKWLISALLFYLAAGAGAQEYASLIDNYDNTLFTLAEQARINRELSGYLMIGAGALYASFGFSFGNQQEESTLTYPFYSSAAMLAGLGLLNLNLKSPVETRTDELIYHINSGLYTSREQINNATLKCLEEVTRIEKTTTVINGSILALTGGTLMVMSGLAEDKNVEEISFSLSGGILIVEGILMIIFYEGPYERFYTAFKEKMNSGNF